MKELIIYKDNKIQNTKVYLICVRPCAGKTTHAKHLESKLNAIRFSTDEWMSTLYNIDGNFDEKYRNNKLKCKELIWKLCKSLIPLGIDIILDFGFWKKFERDAYKSKIKETGATPILHYLPAPNNTLKGRIKNRNKNLPFGVFYISDINFEKWISWFEPPLKDEEAIVIK